jgi:hypothetical protein
MRNAFANRMTGASLYSTFISYLFYRRKSNVSRVKIDTFLFTINNNSNELGILTYLLRKFVSSGDFSIGAKDMPLML